MNAKPPDPSPLPYLDTKPQGAPDFYFAINATFRFLDRKLGRSGWLQYLRDLGTKYFAPVNKQWKEGGLPSVAEYWKAFFAAEPGSEVSVECTADKTVIQVHKCPAIAHLRKHGREIVPFYCQHCYYLGETRASQAGLTMRLEGGNGRCTHTYYLQSNAPAEQDLSAIKEATV